MKGHLFRLVLASVASAVIGGSYLVTVHFNAWRGVSLWDPGLALDYAIPSVRWMIIPYVSLYFYFPIVVFATPASNRGQYQLLILHQFLLVLAGISYVMFLLVPAEIRVVKQALNSEETYSGALAWLYKIVHRVDSPYNAGPSTHVSLSILIACYLGEIWGKPWNILLLIAWGMLAASTLTTKQHYIFDLSTGTLLGFLAWCLIKKNVVFVPTNPSETESARER